MPDLGDEEAYLVATVRQFIDWDVKPPVVEMGHAIDAFADATGDHQWIHVDPVKAAEGPYGRTIAHGYLTLSLLPVLGNEVMEIRGFWMMINYGADKVRFPAPVPVGSRIRAGIELTSLERKSAGVQLNSLVTVEVEGSDRPAVVAETVRMMVE